jgi:hypothetical protein
MLQSHELLKTHRRDDNIWQAYAAHFGCHVNIIHLPTCFSLNALMQPIADGASFETLVQAKFTAADAAACKFWFVKQQDTMRKGARVAAIPS